MPIPRRSNGGGMKLEDIGFYTLSDERAETHGAYNRLQRCEVVLSSRCNFKCPYCRRVGGDDLPFEDAVNLVSLWGKDGLRAIRFSGGEPMLYRGLDKLVCLSRKLGMEWIAVSSNGSISWDRYQRLIDLGVNDFSISLDACCAEDGDKMSGGVKGAWNKVVGNIRKCAEQVYTTVGVVLTNDNILSVNKIISFAASLGVADIRIIPAAQEDDRLHEVEVDSSLLERFPILRYRINNLKAGKKVRGLEASDSRRCGLVLDDMAVNNNLHYPCIIYMREGGNPIGAVGENMRQERERWSFEHDTHLDPICSKNCLDVCVDFNNKREIKG